MPSADDSALSSFVERLGFFFSDSNLRRDKWMRAKLDESGGLTLDDLLSFNTIKTISTDKALLANAAQHEDVKDLISYDAEKEVISRKVKFDRETAGDGHELSIVVHNLPLTTPPPEEEKAADDGKSEEEKKAAEGAKPVFKPRYAVNRDEVKALFEPYGKVGIVQLRWAKKHHDRDDDKYGPGQDGSRGYNRGESYPLGMAFVEFQTADGVKAACADLIAEKAEASDEKKEAGEGGDDNKDEAKPEGGEAPQPKTMLELKGNTLKISKKKPPKFRDDRKRDSPAERKRQCVLDLRMVLFAAICDVRNDQPEPTDNAALLRSLRSSSIQADLQLDDASMRLLCCFVQPSEFISRPEQGADHLADAFRSRPADRVTQEMVACLAGMVAVTLGTEPERLHLFTHLTAPGELANTFGVGDQYGGAIGHGTHYDCGCELTADGDYGRPGVRRAPLSRHSLYFALFTSFGALAISVLTQPGADGRLHPSVITAPGQTLRGYLHGVVAATWSHMSTKLNLVDSEQLCLLVLRSLERLRQCALEQPQDFRRLFRTLNQVQTYEQHVHNCFGAERARLQAHVDLLNKLAEADRRWVALSAYSAAHPAMQIAVHYSDQLIKEHVAFAEALEASLAVPEANTRNATALLHMFTQRCHQLRFLWVLPDLIQLYQWLHSQLDTLFFEQKARLPV